MRLRLAPLALLLGLSGLALQPALCKLPPRPVYAKFNPFSRHPKGCNTQNPLWVSYEWGWDDYDPTRIQAQGKQMQQGCYPYNSIIPRKGTFNLTAVQHLTTNPLRHVMLRLWRPDLKEIPGIQVKPDCNITALIDRGQYYGPVGCLPILPGPLGRIPFPPENCTAFGGSVTATYPPSDQHASNIDCSFPVSIPYDVDASNVKTSGAILLEAHLNFGVLRDPGFDKPRIDVQTFGDLPVLLEETAQYPCPRDDTGTEKSASRGYCGWSLHNQWQVSARMWTNRAMYTQAFIGPIYLLPINGPMRLWVRSREWPPVKFINANSLVGANVTETVITFDDDSLTDNVGKVVVNLTGMADAFLYNSPMLVDLAANNITEGWRKMSLVAKAPAPFEPPKIGVQTASTSVMIEVAPKCPPTMSKPFMTMPLADSQGQAGFSTKTGWTFVSEAPTPAINIESKVFPLWTSSARAFYYKLSFDLSWLDRKTTLRSASLFVWVSSTMGGTLPQYTTGLPAEVYDGSLTARGDARIPCLPITGPTYGPGCTTGVRFGATSIPTSTKAQFVELKLTPTLLQKYVGKKLNLAVMLQQTVKGGQVAINLRGAGTGSSPFLVMTGTCPQPVKRTARS